MTIEADVQEERREQYLKGFIEYIRTMIKNEDMTSLNEGEIVMVKVFALWLEGQSAYNEPVRK